MKNTKFDMTKAATDKAIYAVASTLAYKYIGENDIKKFEFAKLKARFGATIKAVHDGQPLAGDINKLFAVKKINGKTSAAAKYLKVLKTEDLKTNAGPDITAKAKPSANYKTSQAPRLATGADLGLYAV
jgi:hypothetical protein|tara:strand:+ start:1715 stop:2101 length:387 start_codon:yes stop_codon:yes gene_type:complete